MDDETDLLLDQFLAVASGERTEETRDRYRRVLQPLRTPADGETGAGPGVRILLRIPPALEQIEADEVDKEGRATAPSLWTRLVTWLRRNSDVGDDSSACALLEAQARLRDAREQRREERYSSLRWMPQIRPSWQQPPASYLDGPHFDDPYREDLYRDGPYRADPYRDDDHRDAPYGEERGRVVPLVREPRWMPELS